MTKIIPILAIVILAVGIQSAYACAPENVQHWNKIVFEQTFDFGHPTLPLPILNDVEAPHEIIVQIDPNVPHVVRQLVVDKLTELGYKRGQAGEGGSIQLTDIATVDVTYSTICGDFDITQVIGGLLIQPDTATLVLAYGIANAIWLVPSIAGIGIAVYLTKNRWQKH